MILSIWPIEKEIKSGERKKVMLKYSLVGVKLGPNRSNICGGYNFISTNYCFLVQYIRSRLKIMLGDVECWITFERVQTFHPTSANIYFVITLMDYIPTCLQHLNLWQERWKYLRNYSSCVIYTFTLCTPSFLHLQISVQQIVVSIRFA